MSIERYAASSPYAQTPQTSWRLDRYVHRAIPAAADDVRVELQPRHTARPDILSYELYGSPAYWWVIAVRNPTLRFDPVFGLKPGMVINMPSAARLKRIVGG